MKGEKIAYYILFNSINYEGVGGLEDLDGLWCLLDLLRVKIERWSFLTFPKYTYRSV